MPEPPASPWEINSAHAVLALEASLPVFPYLLDLEKAAGVRLAIDLRVRGSRPVVIRIEDQSLAVDDCQGQLLIWGRRPWRMAELATLLQIV